MLLNMVLQESECCCEWLERCLNAIPFPEMQWKYFFTSFSHFLVKWHPPIFFTFFFIFMEHKYFFPFQQESIFLHFFQLVSSPRTPNVSADRSTKICSVHFLTDHPVWRISYLPPQSSEKSRIHDLFFSKCPASPMIIFATTSGGSGLLSLQERKRSKRFAPTALLCNTGCTTLLSKPQSRIQNLSNWNISIQDNRLVWRLILNLGVFLWHI